MVDQRTYLIKIMKGKVVTGTYQGVAFHGVVTEMYPDVLAYGHAPISFTVELANSVTGIPVESGNSAVFYSKETWKANNAILTLNKVAWGR
jgi:hypothetical protein